MKITPLFHQYVQRLLFEHESGLFVIIKYAFPQYTSTVQGQKDLIPTVSPIVVVFFKSTLPQYHHDAPHMFFVPHVLSSSSAAI